MNQLYSVSIYYTNQYFLKWFTLENWRFGFEAPDPLAPHRSHTYFSAKTYSKNQYPKISIIATKTLPNWPKNGWVMIKNACRNMCMRPFCPFTWPNINIFQWLYQVNSISTIKLHILCKFQLNISKNVD